MLEPVYPIPEEIQDQPVEHVLRCGMDRQVLQDPEVEEREAGLDESKDRRENQQLVHAALVEQHVADVVEEVPAQVACAIGALHRLQHEDQGEKPRGQQDRVAEASEEGRESLEKITHVTLANSSPGPASDGSLRATPHA